MALLDIKNITTDGGTQHRAHLNTEVRDDYAAAYSADVKMPPVRLIHDGKKYWLWDGFTRLAGAIQAGRRSINVEIERGTQRDAFLKSLSANHDHGLRRSNEDKRRAVKAAIGDEETAKLSNREIAELCAVSHAMVNALRPTERPVSDELSTGQAPAKRQVARKSINPEEESGENSGQVGVASGNVSTSEPLTKVNGATYPQDEKPAKVATPKPAAKGPLGSIEVITRERDEAIERAAELATQLEEVMAENAELTAAVEMDDAAKAMQASNKALRKELAEQKARNAGLINENNAAIRQAKAAQTRAKANGAVRH